MGVHEACLHQFHTSCVIGAIPTQVYRTVSWWSPTSNNSTNTHRKPSKPFVIPHAGVQQAPSHLIIE